MSVLIKDILITNILITDMFSYALLSHINPLPVQAEGFCFALP